MRRLGPWILIPAMGIAACGERPPARNVILVTLDTTRADRIGVYGRPDARTPVLDRLARAGVLFETAVVDVPVTLPSHTTLMTGLPALAHGVRWNTDCRLGEEARTLAELFKKLGYSTGAVISSLILDSQYGIGQGFEYFDDDLTPGYVKYDKSKYPPKTHWLPNADRRAGEAMQRAITWLEKRGREPFFLWLHVYDPHFPYDPPPPWGSSSDEDYLAEIQYTDHQLGRLVRWLESRGLLQASVLLVTADHGEGLDQHREDHHGIFLYDDTLHVPLILRAPGAGPPGLLVREQVRSLDVAPTLLELSGHRRAKLGTGGSLVPLVRGTGSPPDTLAYCESIKTKLFYGGSGLKSLRTHNLKFVWAPRVELYDLAHDPGETRNLAPENPALASRFRRLLDEEVRSILRLKATVVEPLQEDEARLEAVRSLGYLSGAGGRIRPRSFDEEMKLAGNDPKDLVDVSLGAQCIQNGFYDEAERRLLRFFRTARRPQEDPRMPRLWAAAHFNYAKLWMIRGRYERAAEEYREALRADPAYENARWCRIYALNLAGRLEQAVEEASVQLDAHPRAWKVRLHRGLALALLGQREAARRELQLIAQQAPASLTVSRNAVYYLAKIGSPEEKEALEAYLATEASG